MRTLNQQTGLKRVAVVYMQSFNYIPCWMTEEAYKQITLTMSTGDFHTHKALRIFVEPETIDKLRGRVFVEHDTDANGLWYWSEYDANFESFEN